MKVVLDTNVVIDAVALRQPFCEDAKRILLMVAEEMFTGYLTANSVTDIFYVVRRSLQESKARKIIRSLLYSLEVIELSGEDCRQALDLAIGDFEDALLATCAKKIGADYIISRDEDFSKTICPVQIISPSEFLLKLS